MTEFEAPGILVAVSRKESVLLTLLRARKYSRIEIEFKGDEIGCIYVDEDISPSDAKVEQVVHNLTHQTVTITKHDGELVRIKRRIPIKL